MTSVVTSCSAKGWNECGWEFVESFLRYWPSDIRLYVVSEDTLPTVKGATFMPLGGKAMDYLARNDRPRMKGRVRLPGDAGWTPKKVADGYNFRYDAYRFAKKVFAIEQVADAVSDARLYWIDADVVTFARPPEGILETLLPNDVALCCLDRGSYHSECGFVGYNLDHPLGHAFIKDFAALFETGEVFGLQEWHDSWVFDWLRRKLNVPTRPIPHTSRHHPFVNSILGMFMDHRKGARKEMGRTPVHEITSVQQRAMPYWSGR